MIHQVGDCTLQFIAAFRRRSLFHRIIDALLTSAAATSLAASILVLNQSLNASIAIWLVGSAAMIAGLLVVLRFPDLKSTVTAVDQALNTQDLLGTALHSARSIDGFAVMVRHEADTFCRSHRAGDVPLSHLSAQRRVALLLALAIGFNLIWLRQSSNLRLVTGTTATINVIQPRSEANSLSAEPSPTLNVRPETADSDEPSAAERSFGESAVNGSDVHRRSDAFGPAAAQTLDATNEPLSAVSGGESPQRSGDSARSAAVAPDHGEASGFRSDDFLPSPTGVGSAAAAAAPDQYRDLIRAYFLVPSH